MLLQVGHTLASEGGLIACGVTRFQCIYRRLASQRKTKKDGVHGRGGWLDLGWCFLPAPGQKERQRGGVSGRGVSMRAG